MWIYKKGNAVKKEFAWCPLEICYGTWTVRAEDIEWETSGAFQIITLW